MAELDLNKATTTDLTNVVPDFIVDAKALDVDNKTGETFWYFSEATKNFGYYFQIPEIHSSANILATYTTGKGYKPGDNMTLKVELDHLSGMGVDSFQSIMWNMHIVKKIVGDAFAEIVKEGRALTNLIPISPERVRLVLEGGRIKRYDVWNGKEWKRKDKKDIFHITNNRIGDQVHGTSQIDAVRWVIDFRNELLVDVRKLSHRDMALGIAYYDTDNEGKITFANSQIEKAVKNGEMLGLPKDTVEIKEFPSKNPQNKIELIRLTGDLFYQTFEVPKVLATSEGFTEAGSMTGFLTFEPIYTREQAELEAALWSQIGIKVKFIRPPQLGGVVEDNQDKNNAGAIQPTDITPVLPETPPAEVPIV